MFKSDPSEQGAEEVSATQSSLLMHLFLLMSLLNVLFLKKSNQNVHEHQQAKSKGT